MPNPANISKTYRLLLFDCVNTLYLPDTAHLPTVEVDGREIPSTAGLLQEKLRPLLPEITAVEIHHAARASWRWAEIQRGEALEEVPGPRRFRQFLKEIGLRDHADGLPEELLEIHMGAVIGSFDLPRAHVDLLSRLRKSYRIGLFSNFDHGPSLRRLLHESGIGSWFEPLIISDGLGFRKPGREAFSRALALTGEAPEAVLFVGDSLEDDVTGALEAGVDIAWINSRGLEAPSHQKPTYELSQLIQLKGLLEGHP